MVMYYRKHDAFPKECDTLRKVGCPKWEGVQNTTRSMNKLKTYDKMQCVSVA